VASVGLVSGSDLRRATGSQVDRPDGEAAGENDRGVGAQDAGGDEGRGGQSEGVGEGQDGPGKGSGRCWLVGR